MKRTKEYIETKLAHLYGRLTNKQAQEFRAWKEDPCYDLSENGDSEMETLQNMLWEIEEAESALKLVDSSIEVAKFIRSLFR